jgi:hypothetical protein
MQNIAHEVVQSDAKDRKYLREIDNAMFRTLALNNRL